jgi:hypothetical protein
MLASFEVGNGTLLITAGAMQQFWSTKSEDEGTCWRTDQRDLPADSEVVNNGRKRKRKAENNGHQVPQPAKMQKGKLPTRQAKKK